MLDQLEHLLAMTERPNIHIQIVPYDAPCTVGLLSAFTIAELPEAATTVSVDSATKTEVSADPELVSLIWTRYDKLRSEAHRPSESLRIIKETRQRWTQES
ncbi:hypothetical protein Ssi02_37840 [Sinosporangium siamense]|uniref:DUF5753 domain-containing protein n=2 Tax=Sinosporangium siamense TaxID=1367973 RepID=A0A919RGQ7_9ACTN|nr:hypothetical protein Ssi02_37840 [Sinosporangium siamense]